MGKEFVEYQSENGRIPYSASTLCFCLTQYAKDYISDERKLTSKIDSKVRDAVIVDAINFLGYQGGIEEDELYLRYIQFACFSPIFLLASEGGKYYKREPWKWNTIIQNHLLSLYSSLKTKNASTEADA